MNKNDLREKLQQEGIRPDAYCLNGGLPNESYCLNESNNQWEVYYSERGNKSGLKVFDNENDACQYLYQQIKKATQITM